MKKWRQFRKNGEVVQKSKNEAKRKKGQNSIRRKERDYGRRGNHPREIRGIFRTAGFSRVAELSKKQFTFKGTTSDIDDFFVYENLFVFVECSLTTDISTHLKRKYVLYQKINSSPVDFISYGQKELDGFPKPSKYSPDQCIVKVLYCVPADIRSSLTAHPGSLIHDEEFAASRLSMMRIMARRTKAATVMA